METQNCCILIFAKYPQPGFVKTRLADALGSIKAAELYKCMALDTIDGVKQTDLPFEIVYWPAEFGPQMQQIFGTEFSYMPQIGEDLSERLDWAFKSAFAKGFEYAIAIGSDSPDIPGQAITDAFAQLSSKDVVIGPTMDGGYYLIGFSKRSFDNAIFDQISWSTPEVLNQTLRNLAILNKTVRLLNSWCDIDTLEHIQWFTLRYRSNFCTARRTLSYILREFPLLASSMESGKNVRL